MNDDQAQAVDPMDDLMSALGGEEAPEDDKPEEATEPEAKAEEPADDEEPPKPDVYRVKVRGDDGAEHDEDLTAEELAAGYMRNADYSRKTQDIPKRVETEVAQRVTEIHTQAIDQLNKLQALAIEQAAPDLLNVDLIRLATEDPAQYVAVQAKQMQLRAVLDQLEQRKSHHLQQQTQAERQLLDQAIAQSEQVLAKSVKGFNEQAVGDILAGMDKQYGISRDTVKSLATAIAKAKLPADTLGKLLLAAHEGKQWRDAQSQKAAVMKKVVEAPKVLKPGATQPKNRGGELTKRLKESGRVEDLAAFL